MFAPAWSLNTLPRISRQEGPWLSAAALSLWGFTNRLLVYVVNHCLCLLNCPHLQFYVLHRLKGLLGREGRQKKGEAGILLDPVVRIPNFQCGGHSLIPGHRRSPGEGNGNPLQYSCLEKSHGQRSLVGYNPWCHRRVRCDSDVCPTHWMVSSLRG